MKLVLAFYLLALVLIYAIGLAFHMENPGATVVSVAFVAGLVIYLLQEKL